MVVSFASRDTIVNVPARFEWSDNETECLFFSAAELKLIRQRCGRLVYKMEKRSPHNCCERGLEGYLRSATHELDILRDRLYDAVYAIQSGAGQQQQKYPPIRRNGPGRRSPIVGSNSTELLARVCRRLTKQSTHIALVFAQEDAEEAQKCYDALLPPFNTTISSAITGGCKWSTDKDAAPCNPRRRCSVLATTKVDCNNVVIRHRYYEFYEEEEEEELPVDTGRTTRASWSPCGTSTSSTNNSQGSPPKSKDAAPCNPMRRGSLLMGAGGPSSKHHHHHHCPTKHASWSHSYHHNSNPGGFGGRQQQQGSSPPHLAGKTKNRDAAPCNPMRRGSMLAGSSHHHRHHHHPHGRSTGGPVSTSEGEREAVADIQKMLYEYDSLILVGPTSLDDFS
eukprot:Nitzschia sp. Nitz4//scaffold34_size148208//31835//33016//NITZ4_002964-RA/size148208-processed-gene-0.7-mRNA-1//1//CDS//3329548747//1737//frame0